VPRETPALDDMVDSLMRHGALEEVTVGPLDRDSCAELARRVRPDLDDDTIERIWAVSGGVPFTATELARSGAPPDAAMPQLLLAGLDRRAREVVQRVAVAGTTFDTDEFLALSGLDEDGAYECLDLAIAARVVERADAGYRFRHALVRDALLADLPPHRMRVVHREAARRLEGIGASPARVGFHLLRAGDRAAVPYLLQAAETDAALGAASDALELLDAARPHARGEHLARLLALRGDVLFTLGDVRAIGAYREAIDLAPEGDARRLRAKLGRAAVVAGDLATAGRALAGLEPDGGPDDAEILLARANHAYFTGDIDRAWEIAERAHALVAAGNVEWQLLDLVSLRGLIAHNRGEWFEQLRQELGRTRAEPRLATAMFDGQLCVAEYLLYGPVPYQEVIELARGLREAARRAGVLRAVAFAAALEGEAALLAGDLDAAERLLQEAVDLHHELGGHAGEAHSLQRLAELRLAQGRPDEARELLQRALPLARFSTIALHLLQRIHGTLVAAAPDPAQARAEVDHALATLGTDDHCPFCSVMFEVPATIACAAAGDLDAAARHLAAAEQSAARWQGRAWEAAVLEARAHVTAAGGRSDDAERLRAQAIETFARAGHHHDARRCREAQLPMPANADAAVASQ
jgi:tetratricopeptide (TPR) repeat protein